MNNVCRSLKRLWSLSLPWVRVVPFLTVSLLFACGKTARLGFDRSTAIAELLTYENQDLLSLDPSKVERLAALADRVRGRTLSPAYVCRMRAETTSESHVVYFELPFKDGWPGFNRMSATVLDITSFAVTPLEQRQFSMGSRTKAVAFEVTSDHGIRGLADVLVVNIVRGGPHQWEWGRDFYVLSNMNDSVPPRLLLLRREDNQGRALRLTFTHRWHDRERLMDGAVPVYDTHISWSSVLQERPLAEILAAMLFLNSYHDYESDRAYQHVIEAVPQYLMQSGVTDGLLKHNSAWVREYASMLIELGAKHSVSKDQPE